MWGKSKRKPNNIYLAVVLFFYVFPCSVLLTHVVKSYCYSISWETSCVRGSCHCLSSLCACFPLASWKSTWLRFLWDTVRATTLFNNFIFSFILWKCHIIYFEHTHLELPHRSISPPIAIQLCFLVTLLISESNSCFSFPLNDVAVHWSIVDACSSLVRDGTSCSPPLWSMLNGRYGRVGIKNLAENIEECGL